MVQTLLALDAPPKPDHAADALAVAICHVNGAPLAAAVAESARRAAARRARHRRRELAVDRRLRPRRRAMIALVRGEVAVRRADHVVVLAGGVGYRLAVSAETLRHVPGGRRARHAAQPPRRARRRARRSTASPPRRSATSSCADRRAVRRAEGRARRASRRHAARAARRARGRRRRAPAGGARHRQAHGGADRRRAAREGRRPPAGEEIVIARGDDPRAPRPRRPGRARLHVARPTSCCATSPATRPRTLIAHALRGSRRS